MDNFESLGRILERAPDSSDPSPQRTSNRDGPASGETGSPGAMRKETRSEELVCATCGKAFTAQVSVFRLFGKTQEIKPRECPACSASRETEENRQAEEERRLHILRARMSWRKSCGIPEYLQEKTFDNFDRRFQRPVFDAVRSWADGISAQGPRGHPSLILWSEGYGQGKTHLSVAACNAVIDSWNVEGEGRVCPVRFESGPGMVRRIRATYNVPPDQAAYHETEEMVYHQLRGARLLVLDDVGKEKPSAHTREVYFYVIDERLKLGLPVLITSNLPLEGPGAMEDLMGKSVVSRLIGMCRGNCFELRGEDYRRRRKTP